jgi:hypothetical protein
MDNVCGVFSVLFLFSPSNFVFFSSSSSCFARRYTDLPMAQLWLDGQPITGIGMAYPRSAAQGYIIAIIKMTRMKE